MSDINAYRTPDELAAGEVADRRIREVLDRARANGASTLVAVALGEPAGVVEDWVDRLYDRLRAELSVKELVRAVVMLLSDDMRNAADRVLAGMEGGTP